MKIELVDITPIKAKNWLGNNINNRNISKRRVAVYAQQIKQGDWQLNGETIKLSEDGTLMDGQHRLHAVIQANKAIKSYVLTGVSKDVFKTIDTGRSRGASDILSIAGFPNATALAASVRAYHTIQDGIKNTDSAARGGLTNNDILKFVSSNPEFSTAVSEALSYKKVSRFISPSNAGALYYTFSQKSASDCVRFFHEVETGEGLQDNRATYALREKLISITGFNELDKYKARWAIILLTINAWNAFRTKKPVEKFILPSKFNGYPAVV